MAQPGRPGPRKQPGAPHRGVKLARRAQTTARREWPGPAESPARWGRAPTLTHPGPPQAPTGKEASPGNRPSGPWRALGHGTKTRSDLLEEPAQSGTQVPYMRRLCRRRAATSPNPTSALAAPPSTRNPASKPRTPIPKVAQRALSTRAPGPGCAGRKETNGAPAG